MHPLTDEASQKVNELSLRYGVGTDAVMALLQAVVNGNGTMAQFHVPELGGNGQWMRGGMTMVGDMFNHGLKAKVDGLCGELSQLLNGQPFRPVVSSYHGSWGQTQGGIGTPEGFMSTRTGNSGNWWPGDLGSPSTRGGQNDVRYAYFPDTHRLAVDQGGHVTVYDTLDHQIGGVSQQQGSGSSLTFSSQNGTVSVSSLPIVSGGR